MSKAKTINDYPEVATARANLDRINGDLTAAEAGLRELSAEFGKIGGRADTLVMSEVEAILRGGDVPASAPNLGERIQGVRRRIELLRLAVRQAEGEHSHAISRASARHCDENLDEWRAVARPVAEAVIALAKAVEAEQKFRNDLVRRGIEVGRLSPVCEIAAFNSVTQDSPVAFRLREFAELGVIDPSVIPWADLRALAARSLKRSA